jgi:hypothetical protein
VEDEMVDLDWFRTFFFLLFVVTMLLKLVGGSVVPGEMVGIPLLLFVGTLFIGSGSG